MSNKGRGTGRIHASAVRYRADIDGLRAVAILGVLAYHFGLGVPGGYGGVDVFFVISGFLIAGIIRSELEAGTFSLAQFYVRRIRRILPALTVCLVVTAIAAAFILFPRDFQNFGRSLLAAAVSVSNFFFMNRTGYFDDGAIEKPLLHTWSLGVEEQFYVVFPLTLLLLFTYARRSILFVLAAITVLSFAYSCYAVAHAPDKAFFSTLGRAWELGVGALVAFGALPVVSQRWAREIEAGAGALLIGCAYVFYTGATPFPGLAAIPLCFGVAMIIHSGAASDKTIVARALSVSPMVGVGLISYSVYLWHWPLLVLSVYRFPDVFDAGAPHARLAHVALAVASLCVGALSWRFIETPFRRAKDVKRPTVFAVGAVATVAVGAIASVVIVRPNWLQSWPPEIAAMQFKKAIPARDLGLTHVAGAPRDTYQIGPAGGVPDTIVWGDSFAEALAPGFIDYQKKTGHDVILSASPGCAPLPGVDFHVRGGGETCTSHNTDVLKFIGASKIRRVILVARWSVFAKSVVTDPQGHPAIFGDTGAGDGTVLGSVLQSIARQLTAQNKDVVVIGPVPAQSFDVAPAVAKHIAWGLPLPPPETFRDFVEDQRPVLSLLSHLETMGHVRVVYPHAVLCDGKMCPYSVGDKPMYSDDAHLSPEGVAKLSLMFDEIFDDVQNSRHAGIETTQ